MYLESESMYAQLVIMSRIITHNGLRDDSLENVGNRQSKTQRLKGEIPIVHSIQLGFLPSLGSVTLNEANESAMLRSEWTIQRSHMLSETARFACLSTF